MGREARANQATAHDAELGAFVLSLPVSKIDKEKRLVSGVATAENVDKQGEKVDYETAKKFFTDGKLWPGNIREMHKAEAVGTAVEVECDDANKVITLTARVSKGAPLTWEKCLDGTLKMFSIGGSGKRVVEKSEDGKSTYKRLYLEQLAEVSLVDNGANPLAKFDIVKSVGGVAVGVDDDPAAETDEPIVAKAAAALNAVAAESADAAKAAAIGLEAGSIRKLIAGLARATDRATQKTDIIAKAIAAGESFVAELPLAWQPEAVRKGGPESYDIDQALSAISVLEHLLSAEFWDVRYALPAGATPDPVAVAQVAAIKAAIDAVLRFVVSEHEQQFAPDANGQGGLVLVDDDSVVEMFAKALGVVQKAGARHSKKDQEMVQKVHDVSNALGADCKDMSDEDTEKILKFVGREKVTQVLKDAGFLPPMSATLKTDTIEVFQKITAELETTKAALSESQATVAQQAETVAALDTRLKAIENLPAGGGPVRNALAVEKTLGGPGADATAASPADVVKALQAVADESTDPVVKAAIAKQIIKVGMETGTSHLAFRSR